MAVNDCVLHDAIFFVTCVTISGRNGVAREAVSRLQHVTCPHGILFPIFLGMQRLHQSLETMASCNSRLQRVTCQLQLAMDSFSQRCEKSCKENRYVHAWSYL